MRMVQILAILVAFSLCSASFADQIVLTNGDRLTGAITKSDDKTLVIKTEFAGDVTVQWPAVQEIHCKPNPATEPRRIRDPDLLKSSRPNQAKFVT